MRGLSLFRPAFVLCCLCALARDAGAQTPAELVAQRFDVDPQHSTIAFTSTILGAVNIRGRFTDYDATIICDTEHPERSSVSAIIQVASINTDMAFRDNHLRSPDFFDAKQFPTIEFVSDHVAPAPGGATVSGMLTMHGISRRVTLHAKIVLPPRMSADHNADVAFATELKLSRGDFAIAGDNKYNPDYNPLTNMLSDSVGILLELRAIRSGYGNRKLGTGSPPGVADTVNRVLLARGVSAAIDTYRALKASQPTAFRFTAGQLDVIGHQLAERGAVRDAVEILAFNATQYADTPGVLESLGEAQALANDDAGALETYRRAASKFPGSASAREMVRHLERLRSAGK